MYAKITLTFKRVAVAVIFVFTIAFPILGQKAALKTNLLSDGFLNPNLALELAISPKWTLDISGQCNLWKLSDNRQWRHWAVEPEARYWLCDRFSGHFLGAHLMGGQYNVGGIDIPFSMLGTDFKKIKDSRFQGWFAGAGIAYGYAWVLHEHWNIEAELGIGWSYTRYDQFRCAGCGKKIKENATHNYFGPTKIAVNLEYVF